MTFNETMINEDLFKHHKKKEKRKLLVDLDNDQLQQHKKKKKEKAEFIGTSDYDEIKLKHHKKKKKEKRDLLSEAHIDFNEDKLMQHKNKKAELFIATSDYDEIKLKHHKEKEKKKPDLFADVYTDFNKDELTQHKKKEAELFIGTVDYDEKKSKHHKKKKKKEKPDLHAETYARSHKDEQQHCEKEKAELLIEMSETKQKHHKKTKKDLLDETHFDFNKEELKQHKKKKKKEKPELKSAIEANSDGYEFEINNSDHHKKKKSCLNVAEASAVIDEHEIFSKKHKKRKRHSGDRESTTIFNQHLNCTERDLSHILLDKEISHSLSNDAHNHSHKKRKLENCTLIANKFNDENHDHEINKAHEDVGIIDYTDQNLTNFTDKDLQNSAAIRNTPCVQIAEQTYFSSDVDCSEDAVNFEIPPLHKFETVCKLTEGEKNNLLSSGVFIKTGKFTTAEDKIIQRNFEYFVEEYGVSDPFSLFGIGRYQKDPKLLKFLKAKHFYVRLAKDLNDRSLHSVYKRARIILHPYRNSGRLTEKEIAQIKRLHENHSNKWHLIGDTLGNTAERCAEAHRWHGKNIAKGHFTKEEEIKLIEALKKVSGSSDISCKNMKGISWEKVASYLPSRNGTQCRTYWANNLAWAPDSAKKEMGS